VEFLLRYGLSKRAVALSYEPLWGLRKAGSFGPVFFIIISRKLLGGLRGCVRGYKKAGAI